MLSVGRLRGRRRRRRGDDTPGREPIGGEDVTDAGRQELATAIEKLRDRIGRMRDGGPPVGEQNTKTSLINPLLAAIGWDLENIDEVFLEYRSDPRDNPVDYALFVLGEPRLFVEAKALGADLGDRRWICQIFTYATVVGVEWCVLTNGDEYRLYNCHAPVDADEKLFRRVRISNPESHRDTVRTLELLSKNDLGDKRLNALWKVQWIERGVKKALQRLVWNRDDGLVRLIRERSADLSPGDIRGALDRAHVRLEFSDVGLAALRADATNRRPAKTAAPAGNAPAPDKPKPAPAAAGRHRPVSPTASGLALRSPRWLTLSHLIAATVVEAPLELEGAARGQRLIATVRPDGMVVFRGRAYASLTIAANIARGAGIGGPTESRLWRADGWTFWKYRDPGTGHLEAVDSLRRRFVAERG
jgi:hypothetical protein